LPDLDQRVAHWPPGAVKYAAGEDHPFAQRLPIVLAGQVVVELPDRDAAEDRTRRLVKVWRGLHHRSRRRPQHGRPGVRGQVWRGERLFFFLFLSTMVPPPPPPPL